MRALGTVFSLVLVAVAAAQAHQAPDGGAPSGATQPAPQPQHQHAETASLFLSREASGTSWLPDDAPMYGAHLTRGPWQVMLHGRAYAQFLYESGEIHRRAHQAGSINWVMGMARRPVGRGWFGVRGMLSAEPWTIAGCGYPNLLATGETCDGDSIHDRQHPHDFVMELAAEYDTPLSNGWRWHIYGGPVGEPALGPAAFPHRLSAMGNPLAPIAHHWFDATHISFGVLTSGVSNGRWRTEASIFNGREPDEHRAGLEAAAWDSVSGRIVFQPGSALSLQVSAGRLNDAERLGAIIKDLTRVTASASYHRRIHGRPWATMLAWGRNQEPTVSSQALMLESSAAVRDGTWAFFRFELAGKAAHDLHVHEVATDTVYTVGKLQGGYLREVLWSRGLVAAVGGSLSVALVPSDLAPRYGGRMAPGAGVFVTLRPAAHDEP